MYLFWIRPESAVGWIPARPIPSTPSWTRACFQILWCVFPRFRRWDPFQRRFRFRFGWSSVKLQAAHLLFHQTKPEGRVPATFRGPILLRIRLEGDCLCSHSQLLLPRQLLLLWKETPEALSGAVSSCCVPWPVRSIPKSDRLPFFALVECDVPPLCRHCWHRFWFPDSFSVSMWVWWRPQTSNHQWQQQHRPKEYLVLSGVVVVVLQYFPCWRPQTRECLL